MYTEENFNSRFEEVMERHYQHNALKIAQLANDMFMAERSLRRECQMWLNTPPSLVLQQYRIEKAKVLLLQGKSVKEVAFMVGFSYISFFSKVFKQTVGIRPSEYFYFIKKAPLDKVLNLVPNKDHRASKNHVLKKEKSITERFEDYIT